MSEIGKCYKSGEYVVRIVGKNRDIDKYWVGEFLQVAKDQTSYSVGDLYYTIGISQWSPAPEYEDPDFQNKLKQEKMVRFMKRVQERHLKNAASSSKK